MFIDLECNPSQIDVKALSDGIIEFNRQSVAELEPIHDEKRFHVFAKDADGNVLGGVRATCYWNTLHIELLWLSEESRGKGLGKTLIERAEAYATENECVNAFVETTSWQAKPFYEKNGFELVATLKDRPKGHASHYLVKALTPESAEADF